MATKPLPSPETLRQLLRYEPETGKLFWRERPTSLFDDGAGRYTAERAAKIFNTSYAGKEAFTPIHDCGYRRGSIFRQNLYAHRVIWAIVTGSWPAIGMDIDHVNGQPADNRLTNLRLATRSENQRNRGAQANSRSGLKGVHWIEARSCWASRIKKHGKVKHLGFFSDPVEAHMAYVAASPIEHGGFGRTD